MQLYKLNLHKPLEYLVAADLNSPVWDSVTNLVKNLSEGAECLAEISETAVLTADKQGPHAVMPLPEPLRFGTSIQYTDELNIPRLKLPQSTYLFTQHHWDGLNSMYEALDWFIRESWWQREDAQGPFYVRWVREDNKTAIQILRKKC